MQDEQRADVIIIGGGLIGLVQALALASHGISCHVIDRADPAMMMADGFDGRTSAISSASYHMLEALGLGPALSGKGYPIRQIWVSDGLKPGAIDFVPSAEDGFLGQMFENRILRRAIYEAVAESPLVYLHMPRAITRKCRGADGAHVILDDGGVLHGDLMIVAEGRKSQTREEAGINIAHWQYDHSAIVGAITHEKPHDGIAYEIFYPSGPFAILPMLDNAEGKHRSAIIWSHSGEDAAAYLKLSERAFAAELEKAMGQILGRVALAAPLSTYPLGFHHAARITDERLVLVGDSAHGIHPIAGQGLNLGFRDVAALTEILVGGVRLGLDLGDAQLMERYERWRSVDNLMVAFATDSLTRLFGIPGKTASAVRRFGMAMVQRTGPLKNFFMGEARGESGALPLLLKGQRI